MRVRRWPLLAKVLATLEGSASSPPLACMKWSWTWEGRASSQGDENIGASQGKSKCCRYIGLVENMPSGSATRPGDVVTSMKGDTIEVLNECRGAARSGRCHVVCTGSIKPKMIDLATLTGAIIVSLGSENAGQFSNDDSFSKALVQQQIRRVKGLRLPLSDDYDKLIKSKVADIANMGSAGREAGSIWRRIPATVCQG